jgi:DNA-binding NtrC family response regulator
MSYKLLIVEDEISFSRILQHELEQGGDYTIDLASDGAEAINLIQTSVYDLVLLDIRLPRVDGTEVLKFLQEFAPSTPAIILSGHTDVRTAIQSMKLGAYDFVTKPYDIDELLGTIDRALDRKKLFIDNSLMRTELTRKTGTTEIIGRSKVLLDTLDRVNKIAQTDSVVLVYGPSGTGKELIAHLIHDRSPRRDRPFVVVNCASIPDSLLESELFGHEKGAFTGAFETKQGLVEVAHGGTLFLDEVGDISPAIQPKLLRFVETGGFRRVGSVNELKTDVRIISATNKNLREESRNGRFREDLLYRLNVITVEMPPLKDRREDIPVLVDHFLKLKANTKTAKTLSPLAMEMLLKHDWPGNIRELEHVVEGAIIMAQGDVVNPDDILIPSASRSTQRIPAHDNGTGIIPMEELEKQHIELALKHFNGNRSKTAHSLHISSKTLYLKIKKYGIKTD